MRDMRPATARLGIVDISYYDLERMLQVPPNAEIIRVFVDEASFKRRELRVMIKGVGPELEAAEVVPNVCPIYHRDFHQALNPKADWSSVLLKWGG